MTDLNPADVKPRLKALGLFGLIACCDQIIDKPWLRDVLAIEERERQKRGFERRARDAHVGAAKPMADFDWAWPKKIDREAIEELFSLSFVKTGHNTVLVGPNGVGKTMILKNIAERVSLDISTISRITSNKYAETPFGIVLLKDLFTEGLVNQEGESISNRVIQSTIREVIEAEDKKQPFTDKQLVEILAASGYNIARRTVAKYREQLQIPVAQQRGIWSGIMQL